MCNPVANYMAPYPINNRNNIQQQMDNHYNRLNKKLDHLLQKQPKRPTYPRRKEDCHFYTWVQNLTSVKLNKEETQLLKYGLNYSIQRPASTYAANLIAETERAIRLLDIKMQNTYRIMATKKLKQIINSTNHSHILQKRQFYVLK